MRAWVVCLMFVSGVVVMMPVVAGAVNCDQVRRYLSTGRSVDDVAETMIISVDDVKKCQQSGGSQADQKPAPTPPSKAKAGGN